MSSAHVRAACSYLRPTTDLSRIADRKIADDKSCIDPSFTREYELFGTCLIFDLWFAKEKIFTVDHHSYHAKMIVKKE